MLVFVCCGDWFGFRVVYSADRSGAVVPVLVLLFVALRFVLRGDLFCVLPCVILFLCFSVLLALRLPRLVGEPGGVGGGGGTGESGVGMGGGVERERESTDLGAFRAFVRFVLVWVCRFPPPLGIWEGLRFVIVALPGLFSYSFFKTKVIRKYVMLTIANYIQ